MYSIGSSMVRMCSGRLRLIQPIIAASVVDLPEPVGPVISTSPWGRCSSGAVASGRPDLLGGGDLGGNEPQGERRAVELEEGVGPEAGGVAPGEGEVELALRAGTPRIPNCRVGNQPLGPRPAPHP